MINIFHPQFPVPLASSGFVLGPLGCGAFALADYQDLADLMNAPTIGLSEKEAAEFHLYLRARHVLLHGSADEDFVDRNFALFIYERNDCLEFRRRAAIDRAFHVAVMERLAIRGVLSWPEARHLIECHTLNLSDHIRRRWCGRN
jgi:hypothetical protein